MSTNGTEPHLKIEVDDRTAAPEPVAEPRTGRVRTHWARRWLRSIKPLHVAVALFVAGVTSWAYLGEHFEGARDAETVHAATQKQLDDLYDTSRKDEKRVDVLSTSVCWMQSAIAAVGRKSGADVPPPPPCSP